MNDAMMSAQDIEILSPIVGEIDPKTGLTLEQQYTLQRYIVAETANEIKTIGDSHDTSFLYPFVTNLWPYKITHATKNDEQSVQIMTVLNHWAAQPVHILLLPDELEGYLQYTKEHKLEGFAGHRLPDTRLPCANTWYETRFPAGKLPVIVPLRDKLDSNLIRVEKLAIHAVCGNHAIPFPEDINKEILRQAQLICYLQTHDGKIHIYAGKISYGTGGASLFHVTELDKLNGALDGYGPPGPLSNVSQFICGQLAHMIHFYGNPTYEEFKENYSNLRNDESTDFTEDN